MINKISIDGKIFSLQQDLIDPKDNCVCLAYVSDNGEILGDSYFYDYDNEMLSELRRILYGLKCTGHEVNFIESFEEESIRPLDIVRWKKDPTWVGIVTEGVSSSFSVDWFNNPNAKTIGPRNAWHDMCEGTIEKIANLPDVLSSAMAHPFGSGAHKPYDKI